MADLIAFSNENSLPAVAQAAIAHAQFETIHPFIDGNGRTGRTFIHLILRRRGLSSRVEPPVSLILATWVKDYVSGFTATRYSGRATSAKAHAGMNLWVGRFAGACRRAVEDAMSFEQRAQTVQEEWRERLGRVRSGSAADLLLRALVGAPVITVNRAAELSGAALSRPIWRSIGSSAPGSSSRSPLGNATVPSNPPTSSMPSSTWSASSPIPRATPALQNHHGASPTAPRARVHESGQLSYGLLSGQDPLAALVAQATKYLAWGWWQMMAVVDCSGWS